VIARPSEIRVRNFGVVACHSLVPAQARVYNAARSKAVARFKAIACSSSGVSAALRRRNRVPKTRIQEMSPAEGTRESGIADDRLQIQYHLRMWRGY